MLNNKIDSLNNRIDSLSQRFTTRTSRVASTFVLSRRELWSRSLEEISELERRVAT